MEFVVIQLLYLCRLGCELYLWKHFHARHLPSTTPFRSPDGCTHQCIVFYATLNERILSVLLWIIKSTLVFCVHWTCLTCNKIGFRSEWMIIWSVTHSAMTPRWPRLVCNIAAHAECDAGMHFTLDVIIELQLAACINRQAAAALLTQGRLCTGKVQTFNAILLHGVSVVYMIICHNNF